MLQHLVSAFVLGLVGGLVPGPVLAATFTQIVQSGFLKSIRIILWAMLTETVIALVSLLAFTSLHLTESVFRALSFVGAGILLWIARSIWKLHTIDTGQRVHFSLGKISAMILANGVLWTFWITVCVPKAIFLGQQLYLGEYVFLFLVEIGWLISTVATAILFSGFRTLLLSPKAIPIMFKMFACVFVYFALNMIYTSTIFFVWNG